MQISAIFENCVVFYVFKWNECVKYSNFSAWTYRLTFINFNFIQNKSSEIAFFFFIYKNTKNVWFFFFFNKVYKKPKVKDK